MIADGLQSFAGKKVLLLQGPVGPFFRRLARDLQRAGAQVQKVDFNGGDWLFSPRKAMRFSGNADSWAGYLDKALTRHRIDVVLLFGDCRPLHRIALDVAARRGVEIGVFEEGYVRPDFVTLERHGVNGNSKIPRNPEFYKARSAAPQLPTRPVGNTFWYMALWAMAYYVAAALLSPAYPGYRHHRPLGLGEGWPWLRSAFRKHLFKWRERGIEHDLASHYSGRFFLAALQVHNDAQIHAHSEYASVEAFIAGVIKSFRRGAPRDTLLVIKHHPMDRGYHDYSRQIAALVREYGLHGRVRYIHDQHLPTLLTHARGVVLINSTVGLSALDHCTPLKVCGTALYDLPGLTFQGRLDDFWREAVHHRVDKVLSASLRNYLIDRTQLNGNFYRRLRVPGFSAGLVWSPRIRGVHDAANAGINRRVA